MSSPKTVVSLLIGMSVIVGPRPAHATVTDTGFATSVPGAGAHDGWDYVDRAVGSASGKACTSGANGESSRGTASYDPGNNSTYWFPGWDFDPLPARNGMHIIAVEVDVNGSNGQTTSGNINVDIGVTGPNVTTTTTNRVWDGSTVACNWFSTKSGQPRWNVTSAINGDINTIRSMRVRVKRHSNAGAPGSNTYYDIFIRAFLVQVTWMFDAPLDPTNVRKTQVCLNSTTLGWSNNPGNQAGRVCGYEIWRSMDGAPFQVVVPDPSNCTNIWLPEGSTSWTDNSTVPGHTYVYQIRGHGEGGASSWVSTPVGSINWINPAGGSWNTPSNWDQNRLPVTCDFVTISQPGTYAVTISPQVTEIQGILVGGAPGAESLLVTGGTFRVSASEAITAAPGTGQIQFSGTALDTYTGGPNIVSGDQQFWNGEALRGLINYGTLRVAGIGNVSGDLVNEVGASVIVTGGDCCNGTTMLNVSGLYQNKGSTVLNGSAGNFASIIDAREFVNEAPLGRVTFDTGASGLREIRTKSSAESPGAYGFRNYGSVVGNVPGRVTRFRETSGSMATSAPLTLANDASGIAAIANSGNVSILATGSLVVSGSDFSNNGNLSGPGTLSFLPVVGGPGLVNAGTLWACAGGGGIGRLSYTGSFTQTSTGHLHVNLGGVDPGTQYDQIELTGVANLGGTLDVHFVNGFVPPSASGFHIISSNGTTGAFQTVNIPSVAPDTLKVRYTDPGVALVSVNGPVGVDPGAEPARFHMDPPFPSPARALVTLRFGLAEVAEARVEILDARGRSLRTLVHGVLAAGTRTVVWDGRDDRGNAMASGKYFVRLSTHDRRITRPALLLR